MDRGMVEDFLKSLKAKATPRFGRYYEIRCCDGWPYELLTEYDKAVKQAGMIGIYYCTLPETRLVPGRRYQIKASEGMP